MAQIFNEKVKEVMGILSQPDAITCQSACVAMALGRTDVYEVRRQLCNMGDPGSPQNMGVLLRGALGDRYEYRDNASLNSCDKWLKEGCFLITHGWFTGNGHVIGIDGLRIDESGRKFYSVKDPWSEFDFRGWTYSKSTVTSFDGEYSAWGIYAACVAGNGPDDASEFYRRGVLDSGHANAWVHVIRP